jgi:TRAP-type C4-dicarboxylate transport system permease small subunit
MIAAFISTTDRLSRWLALLAVLLLIAAMLVVCQMIFLRYAFRLPTIWQTDFVIYAATASIFLGAPYVLMKKGHIGVDIVENALSTGPRRALQGLGKLLGLVFCAMMLAASASYVYEAWSLGWQTSNIWRIPIWIPTLPMPIGFGMLCLQYVAEFVRPEEAQP